MPIVEVFEKQGMCVQVDSSKAREEVWALVKAQLVPHTEAGLVEKPLTEEAEMLLGLRPYPKRTKDDA